VQLSLRGQLNGKEWKEEAQFEFPAEDPTSPEIERMWASHRIDSLLKSADRSGSRESVIPEVVRLGEDFSIVTEYTSFLVLENDAELKRWNIERRNAVRLDRDRAAQTAREVKLTALRQKAFAGLGPEAAPEVTRTAAQPASAPVAPAPYNPYPKPPQPTAPEPRAQSRNFFGGGGSGGGGGGAVGPIFVAVSAWLARRRQQNGGHKS
jgi:Ca-activated chloride channel family protein